jgi:hypothetical protein
MLVLVFRVKTNDKNLHVLARRRRAKAAQFERRVFQTSHRRDFQRKRLEAALGFAVLHFFLNLKKISLQML